MATIELDSQVIAAAQAEADRRGVDVSVVVAEAVRRFVAGSDLARLLDEFDTKDRARPDLPSEDEAIAIAVEELRAMRADRPAGRA
jgi:enoyl-CoA hydratase/carnithine racemase